MTIQPGKISATLTALLLSWGVGLASEATAQTLTIYSGREEKLIGPLIEKAEKDLGMDIEVRYGDTAELVAEQSDTGSAKTLGERSVEDDFVA